MRMVWRREIDNLVHRPSGRIKGGVGPSDPLPALSEASPNAAHHSVP